MARGDQGRLTPLDVRLNVSIAANAVPTMMKFQVLKSPVTPPTTHGDMTSQAPARPPEAASSDGWRTRHIAFGCRTTFVQPLSR